MIAANLTLQVTRQEQTACDRGMAYLDPSDLKRLGLVPGDRLLIQGTRTTYATAQAATMEYRNQGILLLDDLQMHNCGAKIGDPVKIMPAPTVELAQQITLTAQQMLDARAADARHGLLRRQLDGQILSVGDIIRIRMADPYDLILQVSGTEKNQPVLLRSNITTLTINTTPTAQKLPAKAQLGGLRREFFWLEEWLQALRHDPANSPHGLIIEGIAGCGKSMLVAAVAQQTGLYLDRISATQILADPARAQTMLTQSFATAASQAPALIVIDDIDILLSTSPLWERLTIANQLYAQIDQLPRALPIGIIGLTNQPTKLDPAALRPGRFEQRLMIDPPDRENRLEILKIHTSPYPCAPDVSLERLADLTQGFVGTNLRTLVQHAHAHAQRSAKLSARATGTPPVPRAIGMPHFRAALTAIVPETHDHPITETPAMGWNDIAGLDDIKQILREAVERPINFGLTHDNGNTQPPYGILITGAPGTGKTSIVRALANATRARFIHVDARDIALAPDPTATLRRFFVKARQVAPCMLFFDNLDSLIPSTESPHDDKVAVAFNAFLHEFDAGYDLHGLTILAATHHAERIDQSLLRPGRFDYVINIPLPDSTARRKIFDYHAHKLPLAADVDYDVLAEVTQGFSGADIEGICRRAGLFALRQSVADMPQTPLPVVDMAIFTQILRSWRR